MGGNPCTASNGGTSGRGAVRIRKARRFIGSEILLEAAVTLYGRALEK
jgi:hypothetical protein